MATTLRILVADDNQRFRCLCKSALERAGHEISAVPVDAVGAELNGANFHLLIIEERGCDNCFAVQKFPLPVVIVGDVFRSTRPICSENVFGYFGRACAIDCLIPLVAVVMERFNEREQLRNDVQTLKQSVEDRKLIERAKGVLMRQDALDEATAYNHLQSVARSQQMKMVEVAKIIIATRV